MASIEDIIQALIDRSTEAILAYRDASDVQEDNEIPEEYISSAIVVES
jgi:hypothetical protein